MRPHPRIRRTIKWSSAAATSFLLALWVTSGWFDAWAYAPRNDHFVVGHGSVGIRLEPRPRTRLSPEWEFGFRGDAAASWTRWPARWTESGRTCIRVPLWMPCFASAAVMAIAWRLDVAARRRVQRGRCAKCDYDRTGLTAGAKCPECGTGAEVAP